MIIFKGVKKSFNNHHLFSIENASMPDVGVVAIIGQSGSGKTTLLNMIAGLDNDYEGSIICNGVKIKQLSLSEVDENRIKNIGFVFQDFNLIEHEKVIDNVLLPSDYIHESQKKVNRREARRLLKVVGIAGAFNKQVKNLSGGEKQRVAIARSIINHPRILLCDEPTGSLDHANSAKILELLKQISQRCLVVIISHDVKSLERYADQIWRLEHATFAVERRNEVVKEEHYSFLKHDIPHKGSLKLSFIFRFCLNLMRKKPIRTTITNFVTAIGLVGIGLSIIITDTISKEIKRSFAGLFDENRLILTSKGEKNEQPLTSASIKEVTTIESYLDQDVSGVGCGYVYPFEQNLTTINEVYFHGSGQKVSLPNLSMRSFSEHLLLDDIREKTIYPEVPSIMENDQLVLGINYETLQRFVTYYRLPRFTNIERLGRYISENPVMVVLHVAEQSWQYEDEQIFTIIGVYESDQPRIVHNNPRWNEFVLETSMRFASSLNHQEVDVLPWTMKKWYYLYTHSDVEMIKRKVLTDIRMAQYTFFSFDQTTFSLFEDDEKQLRKRLFIAFTPSGDLDAAQVDNLVNFTDDLTGYYVANTSSYYASGTSIATGFIDDFYLAKSKQELEAIIEEKSVISIENNETVVMPDSIISSSILLPGTTGLTYKNVPQTAVNNEPLNLDQIVISSSLSRRFFQDQETGDKRLVYAAYPYRKTSRTDGTLHRHYAIVELEVVNVIPSPYLHIYHDPLWPRLFFEEKIGISALELQTSSYVLEKRADVDMTQLLATLSYQFPTWMFSSPINAMQSSVIQTVDMIKNGLLAIAALSLTISTLLICLVTYLAIIEEEKTLRLLSVLGIREGQRRKLMVSYALCSGFFAFATSLIQTLVVQIVLNQLMTMMLNQTIRFSFNIASSGLMFAVSLILSLLSGLIATGNRKKHKNLTMLEVVKVKKS